MNSLVIKINKQWIFYCVTIIFVIQPKLFTQYTPTVLVYAVGNLVLFVIYISKYFNKLNKIPKIAFLWILFRLYILLLTLIVFHYSSLARWGYLSLQLLVMILLFEHSKTNGQFKQFFSSACFVLSVYLLINAITLIVFPRGIIPDTNVFSNGDGDYYFLGIKVNYTAYVIPAICSGILYYHLSKKIFPIVIVSVLALFNIFYAKISTGIICIIIIALLIVLRKIFNIRINLKVLLVISVVLNFLILNFHIQNYFENIIAEIFHKSSDFTGRVGIWEKAMVILKQEGIIRLFIGNGLVNDGSFVLMGGVYWPPHNQWLSLLYDVGIIGTIFFVYFLSSFDKYKCNSNLRFYMLSLCAAVLIGTVTMQYFSMAPIYFCFLALYYIGEIEDTSLVNKQITRKKTRL